MGLYLALALAGARRRVALSPTAVAAAGAAYLAALGLSIALADRPTDLAWLRLAAYAPFVLLPWALPHAVRDEDDASYVVRAWLVGAGLAVAVGLVQVAWFYLARALSLEPFPCNFGRIPEGPYPRICGPFRNPNGYADFLAATVPFVVLFTRDLITSARLRWAAGVAVAVVSVFTLSSGVGGIALAAAIAAGARWPSRRRLLLAAGALVAAGFLAASVGYRVPAGRGHFPFPGGEWHLLKGPRVHTWISAVGTIRDHPVTGLGYGSTVAHTPRIKRWIRQGYAAPLNIDRPPTKDAHETWLNVAGQAGVLGLAAFVGLLVVCVRGLGGALRRAPPQSTADRLGIAVLAGLAGVGFHSLFASVEEFRHLWVLLALAVVARRLHRGAASRA